MAQHHAQDHRRQGEPQHLHGEAEDAEYQQGPHVEHDVVEGEDADPAISQDDPGQHVHAHPRHHDEGAQAHRLKPQHDEVGEEERHEDAVGEGGRVGDECRARDDVVDQQRPQHDGGDDVARDAQRHHGDERAAGGGVVGGLGRDDAVGRAGAEVLRPLRCLLGLIVGEDVGDRPSRRRQDAGENTDQRRAEEIAPPAQHLADRFRVFDAHRLGARRHQRLARPDRVLHVAQQLAEGEQADQDGQEREPLFHRFEAEAEALHAVDLVGAHGRHQQAHGAGDQSLHQIVAGQAGGDGEREQHQGEEVPRPELEPDPRQLRRQRHQQDGADDAAEERGPHPDAERQPRPPLARHGKAVEGGRHRGRGPRNAGQDPRHQPAGQPADEHPQHGGETLNRRHAVGERQGEHDRHGDGEARDGAGDEAGGDAEDHQRHGRDGEQRLRGAEDVFYQHGRPGPLTRSAESRLRAGTPATRT